MSRQAARDADLTPIQKLARWSLKDEPAYRDPAALRQAKLLVLDSIGCCYAALGAGVMDEMLELVSDLGGNPEATIVGLPKKTNVLNAVLANGALVRVLDLNDIKYVERGGFLAVGGHPSDNVPVVLAVAEKAGCTGTEVLEAVILNYEIYDRLRQLMPPTTIWDPSCPSGLASAALAGRLMGLDEKRQANALGLAALRTATPKVARQGEMSAGKSLANALVAECGVEAALMAAKGITGPREALDHQYGLHAVFDPARGLDRLWAPPSKPLGIMSTDMKDYPCFGTSQTVITAAIDMHKKVEGRIDQIERIELTLSDVPKIHEQLGETGRMLPDSHEAADHSYTFLPAVVIMDGEMSVRQYEGERWHNPKMIALMKKVEHKVSGELRDRAPGAMPCRIRVSLKGGEELVSECLYPLGHSFADKGLDQRVVEDKFHRVTDRVLPSPARKRIVDRVMALESAASFRALMKTLGENGVSTAKETRPAPRKRQARRA
jgi:2-methylcitrate dehydratase